MEEEEGGESTFAYVFEFFVPGVLLVSACKASNKETELEQNVREISVHWGWGQLDQFRSNSNKPIENAGARVKNNLKPFQNLETPTAAVAAEPATETFSSPSP